MQITIIGTGLSGLILAHTLVQHGFSAHNLCLIDRPSVNPAPGFLLNPLPGRTFNPKPGYLIAYQFARNWLQAMGRISFYLEIPMLRPAVSEDIEQRFERSFKKSQEKLAPLIRLQKLDRLELQSRYPLSVAAPVTYEVFPIYSIEIPHLILHLKKELQIAGTTFLLEESHADGFGTRPNTILACGAGLSEFLPQLKMEYLGGTLAVLQANQPIPFASSAAGHVAPISDNRWVVGSTFFPPATPPDLEKDIQDIKEIAHKLVPASIDYPVIKTWHGIRAIPLPKREPLLGAVPGHKGIYIFSGFGSKGMLWIPYLAQIMTEYLLEGRELPYRYAIG